MNVPARRWWAVVGLGLVWAGPAAAQDLYLLRAHSKTLVRIDGPTGQVLEELPITGANQLYRGLTARWDGLLYTYNDLDPGHDGGEKLFRIDPRTGEGQNVGVDLPDLMVTIAADPGSGALYGTDQSSNLYRIDHQTGETTPIGTIADPHIFIMVLTLAIGRDGKGYATDMYPPITLCSVDLETAEAAYICDLGSMYWFEDTEFDGAGLLWSVLEYDGTVRRSDVSDCSSDWMYTVDYADGLAVAPAGPPCYADCDGSGLLDFFDFLCFTNAFNAADQQGDCTGEGQFDLFDFLCFTNNFNAGC
jgi:hypothetical protein